MTHLPSWSRRLLGAGAALAALALSLPILTTAAGAADPGLSVTGSPLTGLDDGDVVKVSIKTTPEYVVFDARLKLCKPGVQYEPSGKDDPAPKPDFNDPNRGNCPDRPVSTSAEFSSSVDGIKNAAQSGIGAMIPFRVGIGVAEWGPDEDDPFRIICDPDNPCDLVVEVLGGPVGQQTSWVPHVLPLSFEIGDAIAACGGPADGIISTGGSDRLTDAWIAWTLDECQTGSGTGALSRAIFTGEGESMAAYTNGLNDLVYTSLGYDEAARLAEAGTPRDSVMVPVGVNAVVLAIGGGPQLADGNRVAYQDVTVTTDEFISLLAGGKPGIDSDLPDFARAPALQERNPELRSGGIFDIGSKLSVFAGAERSVVAFLASSFAKAQAPDVFRVPELGTFGSTQGTAREVGSSFALATPSYLNAIDTFSGRPPMKKELALLSRSSAGGVWGFMDLATARFFGLTVVKIKLDNGDVVEPTSTSMQAAVERMEENDAGTLVPDPGMTKDGDGTAPYPLTFVEYAMVPAEPLVKSVPEDVGPCELRLDSTINLFTWLEYITGSGQEQLPAGVVPLPDALRADVAGRIEQVGGKDITGPCAGRTVTPAGPTTTTTTTPTTTPTTVAGGGGGGGTTPTTATTIRRSTTPTTQPSASESLDDSDPIASAADVEDEPDIPGFSGAGKGSPVKSLLALVGIIAATTLVTTATARPGRRVGPPTAGA